MTHLLLVTSNGYGVLARITSIISASGINIETAAAYPMGGSDCSVVHLRIAADAQAAERLRRKLSRLIDVLQVQTDDGSRPMSLQVGVLQGIHSPGVESAAALPA